uniref:Uncharacterized protein n=1 Tax=Acrobeloides nanus TaxID=290746 RepID=A0A914CG76_9BILA
MNQYFRSLPWISKQTSAATTCLVANEISAIMVLNADGSVPDNIMIVHPRISSALPRNFSPPLNMVRPARHHDSSHCTWTTNSLK